MLYAFVATFLILPILSIVWCVSNFIKYRKAKLNYNTNHTTQTKEEIKSLKTMAIVSFVVAFIFMAGVIGTIATYAVGIAYM